MAVYSAFRFSEQWVAVLQNHSLKKTVKFLQCHSVYRKAVKRMFFLHSRGNPKVKNRNTLEKGGFADYSSKLFVDFRTVDLSPKLVEKLLEFFRYIFS